MKPKLYIGAPGWAAAGASAYAGMGGPKGMGGVVEKVGRMEGVEVGGVMFWLLILCFFFFSLFVVRWCADCFDRDGPEGIVNVEGGKSILGWAKEALKALGGGSS